MSRRSHTQTFSQHSNSVQFSDSKTRKQLGCFHSRIFRLKYSLNDLEIQKDIFSNVTK